MSLLVAYTDSEGSSDEDSLSNPNRNSKKRNFSEIENSDSEANQDEDLKPCKKRKKIKALPSAKKALLTKPKNESNIIISNNQSKQDKIERLLSTHSNSKISPIDTQDVDKIEALKQNEIEQAKYVQQQFQILAAAEKESKMKKSIQESTRQKNARKQKLGQATFSLKWDRDCGSEMAGI